MREVEILAQVLAEERRAERKGDGEGGAERKEGRVEVDGISAAFLAYTNEHNARLEKQGKMQQGT